MSAISSVPLELDWKLRSYIHLRDLIGQLSVIVDDEQRQKFINEFSGLAAEVLHLFSEEQVPAKSSALKVAIIGDFSSGKSSFINSLFGERFCPDSVAPTTSCISTFRYADEERIQYTEAGECKNISRDKYRELSCHQSDSEQGGKRHVFEIGYPCEVLRSIELIDTPGFNNAENEFDDAITEQKCREADVVFVVMDINKGDLARDLRGRLEALKSVSPESMAFYLILNKTDTKPLSVVQKIRQSEIEHGFFRSVLPYSAKNELGSQPIWRPCADIDALANTLMGEVKSGRDGEWRIDSGGVQVRTKASMVSVDRVAIDDVFADIRMEKDNILWQQGRQKNRALKKRMTSAYRDFSAWLNMHISDVSSWSGWSGDSLKAQVEKAKGKVYERAVADSANALCCATDTIEVDSDEKSYIFTPYARIIFRDPLLYGAIIGSESVQAISEAAKALRLQAVVQNINDDMVFELEEAMEPSSLRKTLDEVEGLLSPLKSIEGKYFDDRDSAAKRCREIADQIAPDVSKALIYPLLERLLNVKAQLDERARQQYERCVGLKNSVDETMERFGFLAGRVA